MQQKKKIAQHNRKNLPPTNTRKNRKKSPKNREKTHKKPRKNAQNHKKIARHTKKCP